MKKLLFIIFILITCRANAQFSDTVYTVTSEIGAGYSFYLTDMNYDELNKSGFAGTLRFMWNPEHLLSIGLETGYEYLYSVNVENLETEFGRTSFSASMTAVPIYMALAMKITDNLKIRGGSGTYLLFNRGEMFGDEIKSSLISIGMHVGLSYDRPINKDFSIGGEIKYSYISKIQDQTLSLQMVLVYELLKW